jgi:hypothetical protein
MPCCPTLLAPQPLDTPLFSSDLLYSMMLMMLMLIIMMVLVM